MGKKANTIKAKKGSKTEGDKVKGADQDKAVVQDASAAPNRRQGFLRLAKGGGKPQPEALKKIQTVPGKGKEPASKLVKKEPGKPRPQFFREAVKFFQSAWFELKKVHWPTRSELMVYTTVVIGSVAVVAVLIWIVDSILSLILSHILM